MGWGVGVESAALPVDHDLVVVPAEGGQVVGVVAAAGAERSEVVGLESVAGPAPVDRAASIAPPIVPEYSTFSAALLPRFTPDSTKSGIPPCNTSKSGASTQSPGLRSAA